MQALSLLFSRAHPLLLGILVCTPIFALAGGENSATQFATSTDGVRIAYEVHGDGPLALVFVHGWSCNRTFWSAQIEPFAKNYKVVAIDLAGHGEFVEHGRT